MADDYNGNIDNTNIKSGAAIDGSKLTNIPYSKLTFTGAKVKRTAVQTLTSGVAATIAWDGEDYDVGNYHDNATNNTRLTVPTTGYYSVGARVTFTSSAANARIIIQIKKNGSTLFELLDINYPGGAEPSIPVSTEDYLLTAGDYLELEVTQFSGANRDIGTDARFWIKLVGV